MCRTYRNIPRGSYRYPTLIQVKKLSIKALDLIKDSEYKLSKNNRVNHKANFRWEGDDFKISAWGEISKDINPFELIDEEDRFIIPYLMRFPNVVYKCRKYLISKMPDIEDVINVIYIEDYKLIELEDSFFIYDFNKNLIGKDNKELNPFNTFRKVVKPNEYSQLTLVLHQIVEAIKELDIYVTIGEDEYKRLYFTLPYNVNEKLRCEARDIIIDAEWKLRDKTKSKWYFTLE